MSLAIRTIRRLNSTPSVFLRPTNLKTIDVALNLSNLAFWSWIAQRSKNLTGWYKEESDVLGEPSCDAANVLATLMRNGIAIVPNFLEPDAFSALQTATASDALRQSIPRNYGTGVLAHYSQLAPELVSHFDAYIRKLFFSLWGFQYSGKISASVQHLRLLAGHEDINDPNTTLHIDRFLPAVKVFYYPNEVKDDGAPFGYVPGSHHIDSRYTESVKLAFHSLHGDKNRPFELTSYYGREEWRLPVPSNTLVVAATHGLHRRIPFSGSVNSDRSRTSMRFIFYGQVTKTRLIRSALMRKT